MTQHEITIPINTPIATADIDDILELNHPDTNIEEIKITHQPTDEEITTLETTQDSTEHKSKLALDSAILNKDPILEKHNILKWKKDFI